MYIIEKQHNISFAFKNFYPLKKNTPFIAKIKDY